MVAALRNGEARIAIDGIKFLQLLGMSESDCEKEGAEEIIANKLFNMSDDERKKLFAEAAMEHIEARTEERKTECSFRIVNPCCPEFTERSIEEIKKDLKHCKNYMQRRLLEQELQSVYKQKRGRYY